jgi:hypothetical protein
MEYFNDSHEEHTPAFEDCWCCGLRTYERHENGAVLLNAHRTKALLMHCWEVSRFDGNREDSTFEAMLAAIAEWMAFEPNHTDPEFEADDLRQQIKEIGLLVDVLRIAADQIEDMIPGAEARVAALEAAE